MTPAIKVLVIANAAIYLLYVFVKEVRPLMLEHLAVGEHMLREPWQPVTALFVHLDPLSVVFNPHRSAAGSSARSSRRTQGTRRFLALFFGAGILGNIAIGLVASVYGARSVYAGPSAADARALRRVPGCSTAASPRRCWKQPLLAQAETSSQVIFVQAGRSSQTCSGAIFRGSPAPSS